MEKQVKHRLSDYEKIELVQLFFESRKSKAAFAADHNIDRKSLARWIKRYENIALKSQEVEKEEVVVESDIMMISISYLEYLELLNIKHKYDVIHSVMNV